MQSENDIVSKWLIEFTYRRRCYFEKAAKMAAIGATAYTGMPHGSDVGRPIESKTVTLLELEKEKKWIVAIEKAEQTMSEKQLKFLELRRLAEDEKIKQDKPGRPSWVDKVQVRYAEWHERRYGRGYVPSESVLFVWWEKIVNITARIAIRENCL